MQFGLDADIGGTDEHRLGPEMQAVVISRDDVAFDVRAQSEDEQRRRDVERPENPLLNRDSDRVHDLHEQRRGQSRFVAVEFDDRGGEVLVSDVLANCVSVGTCACIRLRGVQSSSAAPPGAHDSREPVRSPRRWHARRLPLSLPDW